MYKLAFIIPFLLLGCGSDKGNISKSDTTDILNKALNNSLLNNSLPAYFSKQTLKIIRSPFLKDDHPCYKNGKQVVYVNIDSSDSKLSDWRNPKFYAKLDEFTIMSSDKAKLSLTFRSTGQWFLIELRKSCGVWTLYSFKENQL